MITARALSATRVASCYSTSSLSRSFSFSFTIETLGETKGMDGQHLRPFQVLCARNHVRKLIGHPRKHALSFSPADYQGLRQNKNVKKERKLFPPQIEVGEDRDSETYYYLQAACPVPLGYRYRAYAR